MYIKNLKELKKQRYNIENGNVSKLCFVFYYSKNNKELHYLIYSNYLKNKTGLNGEIFELLGIKDKYSFIDNALQYSCGSGSFPTSRLYDYKGLYRILYNLYLKYNSLNYDYFYNSNIIIYTNVKEKPLLKVISKV